MKTTYINAGAGSGKTHQLTHDLADMLTRIDNPIDTSHIILTTFTKAAAEDFKMKAREVLIKEKHNPAKAAELDSALIGTVHSVCEKFVKKYWYRLGLTLPLNLISKNEKELSISRTAENVASDGDIRYFAQFARDYEMNADFWKGYLTEIIDLKFDFGVEGFEKSREFSCQDIAAIFVDDATDREPFLDAFLKKMVSSIEEMNRIKRANGKKEQLIPEQKEARSLLAGTSLYRKALKVYGWAIDGKEKTKGFWKNTFDESTYSSVVEAAKCVFLSKKVGDDCQACVRKLFKLAEDWEKEYQRFKEENSLLDFNDLEQKFLRILYEKEFEDVRQDISNSYDLLMVDEFQDSNPVQIKIFQKLMELVGETVFVGDRKQAIFGFRGTESSLVDDFIKDINDKDKKSLMRSYRSRPELVYAADDVFCRAFGYQRLPVYPDDDTKPYDGISLDPTRLYHQEMGPALQHWNMPESKNPYIAVGKRIRELVETKNCMIVRKKDDDGNEILEPINYRDIAILLRNAKFHISTVVQALRDAGVPVSVQEDGFMGWAESQLLISLLRYIIDADDEGARADILHLIGGLTTKEVIVNSVAGQQTGKEQELFKKLKDIRSRVSVLSISEIVETLALELDLYSNTEHWGLSETRRRNIGFMIGLARQYEQQCETMNTAPSLPGYIAYASGIKPEKRSVDKTNTVKILTFHNSKGLEWPMVIMDQLDSLDLSDQNIYKKEFSGVHNFRKGDDIVLHVLPAFVSKGKGFGNTNLPQPFLERMAQTEYYDHIKQRKIDEEKRLLYVGFTRAKDYLITLGNENSIYTWPKECNAAVKEEQPGNALLWHSQHPSTYFDLNLYEKAEDPVDGEPADATSRPEQTPATIVAWEVPPKLDSNDKYISPSRSGHKKTTNEAPSIPFVLSEQFHGEKMVQNIQGDIDDDGTASTEDKSARCGTCIHRIFAAFDPDRDRTELVAVAARLISGMGLTAEFPSPESVIDSASQFFNWLRKTHGDATPLHELPFVKRQSDGTVVRGEMDLVWKLPDGQCILVDYKSFHSSEDLASIKAHAIQHGYPAQLKTYKEMLEAGDFKVKDVLIYYFVLGQVIQFDFK